MNRNVTRYSRILIRPITANIRPRLLVNCYSTQTRNTTSALKSSPFALPKDPKTQPKQDQTDQEVSQNKDNVTQEDISDFRLTSLLHGTTDLEFAITSKARDKLYAISNNDKNIKSALKIGVESGGCHGFQYNLALTDLQKELQDDNDNELLVFQRKDGEAGDFGVAQVILDENSLELLQESKVDYTKELIGSQFKVIDSPYTTAGCGCGSSFDFDFEKLQKKAEDKAGK